jgi:hypothetical protein
VRRAKVVGRLEVLARALKAEAGFLLPLLGVTESGAAPDQMDAQTRRRLTFEAIMRVIVSESRIQPVVVIFEDLHWIDSATQRLARSARRCNRHRARFVAGELPPGVPERVEQSE